VFSLLFRARFLPLLEHAKEDCLKVVVGTKRDVIESDTREVTVDEAVEFAKEINKDIDLTKLKGDPYFETSAKTGYNVSSVFEYMFSYCLPLDQVPQTTQKERSSVQLTDSTKPKSSCC
jgi:hypothetical protein